MPSSSDSVSATPDQNSTVYPDSQAVKELADTCDNLYIQLTIMERKMDEIQSELMANPGSDIRVRMDANIERSKLYYAVSYKFAKCRQDLAKARSLRADYLASRVRNLLDKKSPMTVVAEQVNLLQTSFAAIRDGLLKEGL